MKIPFRGAVRGSWARPAGARNLNCHGQQTVVRSAESGMEAEVRESSGAQKENGCGSGWVPDRTRGCLRSGWLVHTRPCEVFQPCHDWRQRPKYMTQGMAAFRSQRRGRLRPTGVGGGQFDFSGEQFENEMLTAHFKMSSNCVLLDYLCLILND